MEKIQENLNVKFTEQERDIDLNIRQKIEELLNKMSKDELMRVYKYLEYIYICT